ncbi:hypothetical protein HQ531_02605 [bacterium]|nr:hypothetical protein [bacterium]
MSFLGTLYSNFMDALREWALGSDGFALAAHAAEHLIVIWGHSVGPLDHGAEGCCGRS